MSTAARDDRWLVEALAHAFRRGGAPTDEHARQFAEDLVADPESLGLLGRALHLAAAATQTWRDSRGLRGSAAALANVGAGLEAIAFERGSHHLEDRRS